MFNKSIMEINWQDLIGMWRSNGEFDFSVLEKGSYALTNLKDNNTYHGEIHSTYSSDTNTVILHLEKFGDVEFWMILKEGFILKINNEKYEFIKL